MSSVDHKSRRFKRYKAVIESAGRTPEFSLSALKQEVREEQPSFVTRTVNALIQDGHLAEAPCGEERYCRWISDPNGPDVNAWLRNKVNGTQIKNAPTSDRPRERLLAHGPASLRTAELLAILIRTGKPGESALQAGEKIANHFADGLDKLSDAGRGELKAISRVIGDAAYCQIMAGIELGRRGAAANAEGAATTKISGSRDAVAFCQRHFARLAIDAKQEEFHIVCLDTKNVVLGSHRISIGTLDASLIHPREVFRPAIKDASASILLVHNHPSGDPTPSPQDLDVTERLRAAGRTLGIDVLDHIVVSANGAESISDFQSQGATNHS